MVQALEHGARGDQGNRRRHRRAGGAGRQDQEAGRARRRSTRRSVAEVEARPRAARRRDADQGQARELRHRRQGPRGAASRSYDETDTEKRSNAKTVVKGLKEQILRDEILERGKRLDGRKFDEIRPITIEVGVLPRTHGSALFTRGETQALVTATLGTADDQQKIETIDGETWKRFMLHYNFPPFSVGEVGRFTRPGPPRDRPRRAGRARAHADDAGRRQVPLHRPRRLRHPRVERLVVDGVGLRRIAGDDGCRRAAQGAGRRRGDGPGDERGDRQVRGPDRHRRRRRPLRRHGLQGHRHRATASPRCRWTSRSAASPPRS